MNRNEIEKLTENVLKITSEMCESVYDRLYPGPPCDEEKWPERIEFALAECIMQRYRTAPEIGQTMNNWWGLFGKMFSGSSQPHTGELGTMATETMINRIYNIDAELGAKIRDGLGHGRHDE